MHILLEFILLMWTLEIMDLVKHFVSIKTLCFWNLNKGRARVHLLGAWLWAHFFFKCESLWNILGRLDPFSLWIGCTTMSYLVCLISYIVICLQLDIKKMWTAIPQDFMDIIQKNIKRYLSSKPLLALYEEAHPRHLEWTISHRSSKAN